MYKDNVLKNRLFVPCSKCLSTNSCRRVRRRAALLCRKAINKPVRNSTRFPVSSRRLQALKASSYNVWGVM